MATLCTGTSLHWVREAPCLDVGDAFRPGGSVHLMQPIAIRKGLSPSGTTRILLSQALRGTVAAAVPLVILRLTGHPAGALFTTIAVLFLSVVDSGGPYRQRLVAMLLVTTIVPLALFAGMHTRGLWYLATAVMFLVATGGGLIRLLGPAGIPIGLQSGLGFIIGLFVPGGLEASFQYMAYFAAGALWTILLTLLVWRVRPYRRIRYQAGDCFRQASETLSLLRRQESTPTADIEKRLRDQQQRNRAAQDEFRTTMGATLAGEQSPPPFLADLIVLLHAAAHLDAAAISLASGLTPEVFAQLPPDVRDATLATITELEREAAFIAKALLSGTRHGARDATGDNLDVLERELEKHADTLPLTESVVYLETAVRQLRIARRATARLAGSAIGRLSALPPLHGPVFPNFSWHRLRANLTFRSLIFRHALRLGIATALATCIYLVMNVPHGIWLPLTVLLILQPHLGATLPRALHRVGGTLIGAVLAGICILLFAGTPGLDVAILLCVFFTIIFIRQRYWIAVTFITPLIILLLDLLSHHPWVQIVERIGNTLGGATIAVIAGYLLWPSPERRRLPEQIADALDATRAYLNVAFAPLAARAADQEAARSAAELAIANVDAALGRMLAEPAHMRAHADRAMAMLTYMQRVSRHLTRLSVYTSRRSPHLPSAEPLRECLDATLRAAATSLRSHLENGHGEDAAPACHRLEIECRHEAEHGGPDTAAIAFQVGEIVDDVNNLAEASVAYQATG